MLNVFQTDILLNEIIRHVVVSVFTGALWLLIVLAVLWLLRVRNPAIKHFFYALVLAKSFVALVREQPEIIKTQATISMGVQFPNPFDILPNFPDLGPSFLRGSSSIAFGPGLVVMALVLIFLLWRFLGFLRFQRIISNAPDIDRQKNPEFFSILDHLVAQARVTYPKAIFIDSSDAPFTVGFRRPVIALSSTLLDELSAEQIQSVLAHEIAHIARRDYIFHWPLVVMRNVLFFSPLTRIVYDRLSFERERACDDFSAKISEPLTIAGTLVRVSEIKAASPAIGLLKSFAPQSLSLNRESNFSRRVMALIEPKPYAPLTWRQWVVLGFGLSVFFYLEIHIIASIYGTPVVLS